MTSVTVEVPDDLFQTLRKSPSEITREFRISAAVRWYQQGLVSQEKAAHFAGLGRWAFLDVLAEQKVDVFAVDMDSLKQELATGGSRIVAHEEYFVGRS